MLVKAGSTDVTTYFHLRLAADGTDATGLTITNIDLTYVRTREEPAAKVDATALTDQDDAHSDNKAIEVDGTNMPGVYRVDWPDAAFAASAAEVILTVKCATAFTESLRVQLTGFDPADGVRAGLTALPNAAADAAGGLIISDAGGLDADAQIVTKINSILDDTGTAGVVVASIANNAITAAAIADGAIDAATFAADVDAEILSYIVDDATRIDASALNTLSGHDPGETIMGATDLGTGSGLTSLASQASVDDLPTNAELATALGTADDAVLAAIAALNNLSSSGAATAVLTTQMTQSYAANGTAPTLAQALFAIHQCIMDFSIAGTSKTVRQLNGSSTAFVITHDSDTAPTAATRS